MVRTLLTDPGSLGLLACVGIYTLVAIVALLQRGSRGVTADWLALLAVSSASWCLVQLAGRYGDFAGLSPALLNRVPLYAALSLSGLMVHYCRAFLRQGDPGWSWLGLLTAWLILAGLLELNVPQWPSQIPVTPGLMIIRAGMVDAVIIGGWAFMVGGATLITLQAFQGAAQPLHRNRIAYWAPALLLTVTGYGLLFAGHPVLGQGVVMGGVLVTAYATLRHQLRDVRQAARTGLTYGVTVGVLGAAAVGGVAAIERWLATASPLLMLGARVGLVMGLAMAYTPLFGLVRGLVNRLILKRDYDPSRAVRDYSVSISNILDVRQLARVSLQIIEETLGAQSGHLFLVDRKLSAIGQHHAFTLRSVDEGSAPIEGELNESNPVAQYLFKEYRPLTQYDVDLLPRFQDIAVEEREWLAALQADVYVPVYSKGVWIGLFAIGPKRSRDRYFDDDLNLLSTLADQTTVALENARLVDNLIHLNRTLREAYTALDQANRQLEHLDRAKSDFIAVLSHELRTPLSIMVGYSQLLTADPEFTDNTANAPIIEGMNKGATRLQELIELMIDMAEVDNQALTLYHMPVPVEPILRTVAERFGPVTRERSLTITLDPGLARLPEVEADPEMLGKVFYHLIINAIKYTPDGGRIMLFGQAVQPGHPRLAEGGIEVVVADTGIGIDPQYLEVIFTKFYRTGDAALHSTGKTKFKGGGPGLGLAIARGIVEAHGGQIWAESPGYDEEKCPGSLFHVVLPMRSKSGRLLNGAGKPANVTGPAITAPVS